MKYPPHAFFETFDDYWWKSQAPPCKISYIRLWTNSWLIGNTLIKQPNINHLIVYHKQALLQNDFESLIKPIYSHMFLRFWNL